jgi:hypothetical protein
MTKSRSILVLVASLVLSVSFAVPVEDVAAWPSGIIDHTPMLAAVLAIAPLELTTHRLLPNHSAERITK